MVSDDPKRPDERRQIEERGVWIKDTEKPTMQDRPNGPPDPPGPGNGDDEGQPTNSEK